MARKSKNGAGGKKAVDSLTHTEEARAIAEARERQLFYVGCTRARDLLRISYAGDPSPFLAIE